MKVTDEFVLQFMMHRFGKPEIPSYRAEWKVRLQWCEDNGKFHPSMDVYSQASFVLMRGRGLYE